MDTTGTYGDNNGDNIGGGNGFNLMTTVFGIVVVFCCVCDVVVGGINERDGGGCAIMYHWWQWCRRYTGVDGNGEMVVVMVILAVVEIWEKEAAVSLLMMAVITFLYDEIPESLM